MRESTPVPTVSGPHRLAVDEIRLGVTAALPHARGVHGLTVNWSFQQCWRFGGEG